MLTKATDIKSIDFLFKIREKGIAQSNEIKICTRNSLKDQHTTGILNNFYAYFSWNMNVNKIEF